jgi:asparagine synthase (glutamine-hydrolysing)
LTFARLVAERFGTDHHEEILEPQVVDLLPRIIQAFDVPFADSSAIPNYLVSQVARRTVTVALAGHGGDELFGGYPRYLGQRAAALYDQIPSVLRRGLASASRWIPESVRSDNWPGRVRRFLEAGSLPADERYLRWITFLPPEWGEEALTPEIRARAGSNQPEHIYRQLYWAWESTDPAERAMALDVQTYLPDDLLVLGDRMSMAHSLEVRVPFCDHVVAQFALGLPARDRFHNGRLKSFLKKTLAPFLPPEILARSKQGFMVPLAHWFNADLKGMVRELLSEETVRQRGYVQYPYVQWLLDEHESGRRNLKDQIYALLVLEIWERVCMEGRPV